MPPIPLLRRGGRRSLTGWLPRQRQHHQRHPARDCHSARSRRIQSPRNWGRVIGVRPQFMR